MMTAEDYADDECMAVIPLPTVPCLKSFQSVTLWPLV